METLTTRQRSTAGIILLFIIIIGDLISGLASSHVIPTDTDPHDTTSLGTWFNMPSATTELLGNATYESAIISNTVRPSVELEIQCVNPSNTVGANLQLQYANFSDTTGAATSGFVNLANQLVYIDGVTSNPISTSPSICPNASGSITVSGVQSLLATLPAGSDGYIFRVMGSGGGGIGDNPRFGIVGVLVLLSFTAVVTGATTVTSLTGFTATMTTTVPVNAAGTATFAWHATNVTSTQCGTGDHCFESGSSSCVIAQRTNSCTKALTFTTAFTGTAIVVVDATKANLGAAITPAGLVNLLQAQTLTV